MKRSDLEFVEYVLDQLGRPRGVSVRAMFGGHGFYLDTLMFGIAWKGRFFDAYSTWFTRAAPFEKPLGESVVKWPEASPGDPQVRFEGFRLDAKRVPTFLYSTGGVRVEERFDPVKKGLRRKLMWDAAAAKALAIVHPDGVTVTEEPGSAPGKRSFIYAWK